MDTFSIFTIVIIIASLSWSVGVLIYALIKKIIVKRKLKRFEKDVLNDNETKE